MSASGAKSAVAAALQALLSRLRLNRLLSIGYFPAELPPIFSTASFAKSSKTFVAAWDHKKILKYWTSPDLYSIPRYGHARRTLALVNPVNQLLIAHIIAENWPDIKERLGKSQITEFKPTLNLERSARAVPGVNYPGVQARKIEILSFYGRYVKTDVARFYSSVYTHAVPWAILGKDWVKTNLKSNAFKDSYANQLDGAIRAGQQGQTIGLPIGPDTSRILSELIMTAVEELTYQSIPDLDKRAVRFVDDLIVGLKDSETAEHILSKLSYSLYEYELEINAEKTDVFGVGSQHRPEWSHFIRTFTLSTSKDGQRADIDAYFQQVISLADENYRDNVLLFATKRVVQFALNDDNLGYLTHWLLYVARRESSCLSFVSEHLAAQQAAGMALPNHEISDFIVEQLTAKAAYAHTDEIVWLLFWAKNISLQIDSAIIQPLCALRSSTIALTVLDLNQLGLISGTIDIQLWASYADKKGLESQMWLLSYEATQRDWWPAAAAISGTFIDNATYFQDLKKERVSFYDDTKKARLRTRSVFKLVASKHGENDIPDTYPF